MKKDTKKIKPPIFTPRCPIIKVGIFRKTYRDGFKKFHTNITLFVTFLPKTPINNILYDNNLNYYKYKKMIFRGLTALKLVLVFVLSGCSELDDILNYQIALDLNTGDCYVEIKAMNVDPGETMELGMVEAVSCTEPHSHEVIAVYSSLPASYRLNNNPLDDLCFDATLDYVLSLHPEANESQLERVYSKFNDAFTYFIYFTPADNTSKDADFNSRISCSIMSRNSLRIKPFGEVIKSYFF